ncbi:LOW QUALITY PROTEIN: integrator complex subunit 5 [Mobula birostris]|uniref:LOW QUALITY PROTEIN: integrator complex subunit 5 n=1 Tax=Mobula birostris TaxID=1983395 RepID=UPI003B27BE59
MATAAMEGSANSRVGISSQELLQEMKAFISLGIHQRTRQGHKLTVKEHARCGILLLRNLPPARAAVLEHLRSVFDESVASYILALEREGSPAGPLAGPGLDDVTQEIQSVLSEFVRSNPRSWAPLVSGWSIDLMGQLSSKYSGRHRVPHASSLNELLQLWMSCKATRALMEIYVQCLSSMISSCPDACVDALLDTSVQHSPHFDWVVAHIGSSFPNTIISRVLSCGLKDFCLHGGPSPADPLLLPPPAAADQRVPKIASVVGILGHLATRHADSIKQELLLMFHGSLGPGRDPQAPHREATVPFLLQLAAMSPALLGAVSAELVESLRPPVLEQLHQRFAGLGREEADNLLGLLVHLVCQSGAGAHRVLGFLLETAAPASVITAPGLAVRDSVREACQRVVQLLLLHLQRLVYGRAPGSEGQPRPVPFLDGLKDRLPELCRRALRPECKRHPWPHQLLGLLAVYCGPGWAAEALCELLALASCPEELALAAQLSSALSSSVPGLVPTTAGRCVARLHSQAPAAECRRLLLNLAALARAEEEEEGGAEEAEGGGGAGGLARALSAHAPQLGRLLLPARTAGAGVAEGAARLLAALPLPPSPSGLGPAQLSGLVRAAASRFFLVLRRGRGDQAPAGDLLARLASSSPAALRAVLRQLVASALHPANAGLFGGKPAGPAPAPPPPQPGPGDSLLGANHELGAAVGFGGVWAVSHAGVIGRGLKPPAGPGALPQAEAHANAYRLLALAVRCACSETPGRVSAEAAQAVALALVEGLCPDVTASELAWPPEEQARGTVERDLQIRNRFQESPLLFGFLRLVALGPPALCHCSVLLRALLATLVAHWEASRHASATASAWPLHASRELLDCMAEGQLLPPELGCMHEVFHLLAPFEVRLLLLGVWAYLRANGPLPQKFSFDTETGCFYREFPRDGDLDRCLGVLHSVLHKNIDRLGHLYGHFQL